MLIEILPQKLEQHRFWVLSETLQHLDLDLDLASEVIPQRSFLQYLVSTPTPRHRRPQNPFSHLQAGVVSGEHEDFEFRPLSWVNASNWAARAAPLRETATRQPRIWVICPSELPHPWSHTPHFNLASYFELLGNARGHQRSNSFLGNNVLYGEEVTSTQTQLTL